MWRPNPYVGPQAGPNPQHLSIQHKVSEAAQCQQLQPPCTPGAGSVMCTVGSCEIGEWCAHCHQPWTMQRTDLHLECNESPKTHHTCTIATCVLGCTWNQHKSPSSGHKIVRKTKPLCMFGKHTTNHVKDAATPIVRASKGRSTIVKYTCHNLKSNKCHNRIR